MDEQRLAHILVVDDDRGIRELVGDYLQQNSFRVSTAADGRQMNTVLAAKSPVDLIVLDLMLPGEDGLSIFRRLRSDIRPPIPVLMLTARSDDVDRIIGLELGADDYLTKPFVPRELVARIRAVLRRVRMLPPSAASEPTCRMVNFGDWRLDLLQRNLIHSNGVVTPLGGAEYSLLRLFLDHPQHILSRDQLLTQLAHREFEIEDRSIDLRVSRLRRRLGDHARDPRYIRTVRNEGYVFAQPVNYEG
ncbi:MAG: DNA-binding response regulator [Proteobacteria bacterium]|nr:DNA-binding response regulator [Pseudomonadota bacterium]